MSQPSLDELLKAGLITHEWRNPNKGMISASVVALGVRKGNPKQIKVWEDLARPGIDVLYPNPKTSGGAMWDIIAIYGAGLKLAAEKAGAGAARESRGRHAARIPRARGSCPCPPSGIPV